MKTTAETKIGLALLKKGWRMENEDRSSSRVAPRLKMLQSVWVKPGTGKFEIEMASSELMDWALYLDNSNRKGAFDDFFGNEFDGVRGDLDMDPVLAEKRLLAVIESLR